MANLPLPSISMKNKESSNASERILHAERLITQLSNPNLRENALSVLSKMTDIFQDLAPLLWNSFGTIATLLQEMVSIYPDLSPPNLTSAQSNRVCNALALLQCVAAHPETKMSFLKANMPLYVYPFLHTTSLSEPFEHLRLASLGVIAALVKVKTKEVIGFLLSSEVMPLCLHNMEIGKEISKTVATFIVEKIISEVEGLAYVCATPDRYNAIGRALDIVLASNNKQPSPRLLKVIIPCYDRLSGKRVG